MVMPVGHGQSVDLKMSSLPWERMSTFLYHHLTYLKFLSNTQLAITFSSKMASIRMRTLITLKRHLQRVQTKLWYRTKCNRLTLVRLTENPISCSSPLCLKIRMDNYIELTSTSTKFSKCRWCKWRLQDIPKDMLKWMDSSSNLLRATIDKKV